jgi:GNAT superfamily N-acetyltransferase
VSEAPPSTRPAEAGDEEFLFGLFASSRADDLAGAGLDPAAVGVLLRLQFRARSQQYEADFPGAKNIILLSGGVPVGRILVHRTAAAIRVVDIAVLPTAQRRGLAATALRVVLDEARGIRLRVDCQILAGNDPSLGLARRVGFRVVSQEGPYVHLCREPEREET